MTDDSPIVPPDPGSITVSPTGKMFMADEVMLRAWQGTSDAGHNVVAMIAMIQTDGPAPTVLTSIPPPMPDKSEQFREMLGQMWHAIGKLTEQELNQVLGMVNARAAYRDEACEERACDHCGMHYRGPAVYCCLRCSLAAA